MSYSRVRREPRAYMIGISPEDNRITYGCINVPAAFYAKVVRPVFKESTGVVYILPETKPLNEVFLAYQAQKQPNLQAALGR